VVGLGRAGRCRSQAAARPAFRLDADLLRNEDGLKLAREAISGVRADSRSRSGMAAALWRREILCIGINYANRNADYGDAEARISSMFYRRASIARRASTAAGAPFESEQLDYEARSLW